MKSKKSIPKTLKVTGIITKHPTPATTAFTFPDGGVVELDNDSKLLPSVQRWLKKFGLKM